MKCGSRVRVDFGKTGNNFLYFFLFCHIGIIANLLIADSQIFCYYYLNMLTKDDLKAIAETVHPLIKAEIKAEGDLIRKDTREMIHSNNAVFGQILRIELAAQKREIVEAVKAGFKEVVKIVLEIKEKQDERIEHLEKRVGKIEKVCV